MEVQVFPEKGTMCVKTQRPERTGNTPEISRTSFWSENKGVLNREDMREEEKHRP
jgi:hypothetical protein